MKNLIKVICTGLLIVLSTLINSCAFPFQEGQKPQLSDISGQLGYNNISRQAFIGGSLLYNPDDLASGHLIPGVHIAVRLGKIDKVETIPDEPEFSDRMDDALYGYITIKSIDNNHISFSYNHFEAKGNKYSSIHSILKGETSDINGDSIPDLSYIEPLKKRPGMEKAIYLTFLSSQDTLNTSMFAVLAEQYSRGVYPNGLIGINPNDQFIITKYEKENSMIRSTVKGLIYGDYVLDYQTGEYQKVTGTGKYRSARNVDDSDLTSIANTTGVNVYFLNEEFNDTVTAENLYNALPDSIKANYTPDNYSTETLVPILNKVLENYNLILDMAEERDIGLTELELSEVRNGINQIPLYELVQINRLFLNQTFPALCPATETFSDSIVAILPLLHCIIGGENIEEDIEVADRGIVKTYSDYSAQKSAIRSQWSKYYSLRTWGPDFPFPKKPNAKGTTSVNLTNEIGFGILGTLSNNWGSSIKMHISAAVFLQMEMANVDLTKNFLKKSLLNGPRQLPNISGLNFLLGPVYLEISVPIYYDIELGVNGNLRFTSDCFMGYTGLYGGGINVGANYGIKWKKILFLRLPTLHFSPFCKAVSIKESTFYAGPINNTVTSLLEGVSLVGLTNSSLTVELNPKIIVNPKITAWKIISQGLELNTGLKGKFTISALPSADTLLSQGKLPISGVISSSFYTSLYGTAELGFDINILGFKNFLGKKWNIFPIDLTREIKLGPDLKVF